MSAARRHVLVGAALVAIFRGVYDYGVCADLGWPTGRPGSGRVKIRRDRERAA